MRSTDVLSKENSHQSEVRKLGRVIIVYMSEVTASLYAWDLADEGVDHILDTLQDRALVNATYLVALMHYEKRPLTDYYYPHNPKRKFYLPEDSRAYWRPSPEMYRDLRIKPLTSERDFLKGKDWLDILIQAARRRGMKTGAEISHTVIDYERAENELIDVIQEDIFGNKFGQLPCWNNPHAREYLVALFCDLVKNYDIDFVQTCVRLFEPGRLPGDRRRVTPPGGEAFLNLIGLVFGGCFCQSCADKAREQGLDWDAIVAKLTELANAIRRKEPLGFYQGQLLYGSLITNEGLLIEMPEFYQWLRFRVESVNSLFKDIYTAIKGIRPEIDFRYNTFIPTPEITGLDLRSASRYLDSVRSSDYSEQSGDPEMVDKRKRGWLHAIRRAIGNEKFLNSAIGVRPAATPELLRMGVRVSAECGADGISLGHYDGATMAFLDAIKQGLEEAEVKIVAEWEKPTTLKASS